MSYRKESLLFITFIICFCKVPVYILLMELISWCAKLLFSFVLQILIKYVIILQFLQAELYFIFLIGKTLQQRIDVKPIRIYSVYITFMICCFVQNTYYWLNCFDDVPILLFKFILPILIKHINLLQLLHLSLIW